MSTANKSRLPVHAQCDDLIAQRDARIAEIEAALADSQAQVQHYRNDSEGWALALEVKDVLLGLCRDALSEVECVSACEIGDGPWLCQRCALLAELRTP